MPDYHSDHSCRKPENLKIWKPDILTGNPMAGLPIRTLNSYYLTSPVGGYFLSFATER
jgi:hypothetical protein